MVLGRRIATQRFDSIAEQWLADTGYHKAAAIMRKVLKPGGICNL